jgi:phage terminase small subunit
MPRAAARHGPLKRIREAEKPQRIAGLRKARETTTMAAAAMVSPDKPLTEKQELFVRYWAEGDTIPNAMHRAGYNEQPSYGYRMAKMPNVLALKQKFHDEYIKAGEISKREVMDMLKESFDMAKLMSEPASMVSAAREIGKLCGYYEPKKVQIDVNMSGKVKFEQMSDAELFDMIEKASHDLELLENHQPED